MTLTDLKIRSAKAGSRLVKLSDGGGLQLWVMPDGAKRWRQAYRIDGKQKLLAIGVYPTVGLREARNAREEAKRLLAAGCDPSVEKRLNKAARAAASVNTFEAVAEELIDKKRKEGKAQQTIDKLEWLLGLARPIGDRPVAEIKASEILPILREVEAQGKHETACKLRAFIGQVSRYAVSTGRAENDPTGVLRGALIAPKVQHRAAIIEPKAFGALLRAIDGYDGQPETRIALQLLALTFVRPGELRHAAWNEFDLDNGVWLIPVARMKMRRPHRVPLAPQVVGLLKELRLISTRRGNLLFPGQRAADRPISENTLNAALRRLGFEKAEMSAHGFRAAASSILNESGLWHADAIERQLAHAENDSIRRAYARADFWDERVRMMTWWSDYCDKLRRGAGIIALRAL
jgi:integrase